MTHSELVDFARDVRAELAFGGDSEFSDLAVIAMDEGLASGTPADVAGALRCARHCFQTSVRAGGDGAEMVVAINDALGV